MKNDQAAGRVSSKLPIHSSWWRSVLFAIGSYCLLKFVIPNLTPGNTTLQKLVQAAPAFAPLATIPFLLLAAKQLYDTDIKKEEPEQPEGDDEEGPQE
jgi:hypothetical protein